MGAREDRRPQLEERHALARHVLATLDEQLRRARGHANLRPTPVSQIDELEQLVVRDRRFGDDQLVDLPTCQHEIDRRPVLDLVDELVVDAAATRPERLAQVSATFDLADEHDPPANPERTQQHLGQRLVARAEERDQDRHEHGPRHVEAEGLEVLAGADRKCERERRDEEDARDDTGRALSHFARCVEAPPPEDEHEQQDEEGEPIRLLVPEQPPEDGMGIDDERAEGQSEIQADHEPRDVDRGEDERADRASREGSQRRRCEQVRAPCADVLGRHLSVNARRLMANRLFHAAIVPRSPPGSPRRPNARANVPPRRGAEARLRPQRVRRGRRGRG